MERVNCNFCGGDEVQVKYRVESARYHPAYLATDSMIGPEPPEEFTVVACEACGLLYLNPRYDAEELAAVYPPEQYNSRMGCLSGAVLFGRVRKIPRIEFRGEVVDSKKNLERLAAVEHRQRPGRILDVGCNNGSFLALLARAGWETYGVDFSPTAIKNAREVFGQHRVFCGELHDVRYDEGFFDAVTLYDTLEHVPNPKQVLQEVKRICKPSALIIIQTVDFDSFNARLFPRSLVFPAQHLYYFRGCDLRQLLVGMGFEFEGSRLHGSDLVRYVFYLGMYWWTQAMVALHRDGRGRWAEVLRRLLAKIGVIHDESEMMRRMKMVAAGNMPVMRAVRTFYFRNRTGASVARGLERTVSL